MSRLVIFGGTGYTGTNIAREALKRGHDVVSYSLHRPANPVEGVDYRLGSLTEPAVVARAAADAHELVVAVRATAVDGGLAAHLPALIDAAITHHARLSFVGGAASSLLDDGRRLLDTASFRAEWKPEATGHASVLDALRAAPAELTWFYVSPAELYGAEFPGETTGTYRVGGDRLVIKDDGSSEISGTDLALAYLDEIETKAHPNQRITVGH
jgi:putative NADH-flavin reductase